MIGKIIVLLFKAIIFLGNFFGFNDIICFYMDLNYEENEERANSTNINSNENDKKRIGYLFINEKNIEVTIKVNKFLYLEKNSHELNINDNKIYEFIQIKSNEIKPDSYVYIKIKNDAFRNMLAIKARRYPNPEHIYKKIFNLLIDFGI